MKNELQYNVPYFQAPNVIFDDDTLKPYIKLVFLYICRCGNNSTAFPSYNTIAKKCGISRRSAIYAIEELEKKNYITKKTRETGTGNFSNVYVINAKES